MKSRDFCRGGCWESYLKSIILLVLEQTSYDDSEDYVKTTYVSVKLFIFSKATCFKKKSLKIL